MIKLFNPKLITGNVFKYCCVHNLENDQGIQVEYFPNKDGDSFFPCLKLIPIKEKIKKEKYYILTIPINTSWNPEDLSNIFSSGFLEIEFISKNLKNFPLIEFVSKNKEEKILNSKRVNIDMWNKKNDDEWNIARIPLKLFLSEDFISKRIIHCNFLVYESDNDIFIKSITLKDFDKNLDIKPISPPSIPWKHLDGFPLNIYYKDENIRIILTSSFHQNIDFLYYLNPKKDYVLYTFPWDWCNFLFSLDKKCLYYFDFPIDRVTPLCNTKDQINIAKSSGFDAIYVNHNCFLDENIFSINTEEVKIYDAVINARPATWKRPFLASKIQNLAIIKGHLYPSDTFFDLSSLPHKYINETQITPKEVMKIINKSCCGLCLSKKEGACYSSSEFLLCGIPIVSTLSSGGRDSWYDDDNSIICEENEDSVFESVMKIKEKKLDPNIIRNNHIKLSNEMRNTFNSRIQKIFDDNKIQINAFEYFKSNFVHKLTEKHVGKSDLQTVLEWK